MSSTLRILLVAGLLLVAFAVVTAVYAQGTTTDAAATATVASGASVTATPGILPRTGGETGSASTATVVLLALGATAGLGGLLLRGLRQPQ